MRFSGDKAGTGQERPGKQWSPGETGGVVVGGLEAFGGQEKEGVPPGLPSRSFSTQ